MVFTFECLMICPALSYTLFWLFGIDLLIVDVAIGLGICTRFKR